MDALLRIEYKFLQMIPNSFSIVIPTHNRPAMLARAVSSALRECQGNGEVVVVDDASTLPARDALKGYNDPRLHIVENPGPNGAAGARNHGVAVAKGSVIFLLDDDDQFAEGYVARVMRVASEESCASFGFAAILTSNADGQPIGYSHVHETGLVPESAPIGRKVAGAGAGFWVRRDAFMQLGGFDTDLKLDEDIDFCVRLIARGHRPWNQAEPGTIVTNAHSDITDPSAQLTQKTQPKERARFYLRTFQNSERDFPKLSKSRWWLLSRYIRWAVKAGDSKHARKIVTQLDPRPFRWTALIYLNLRQFGAKMKRVRETG